MFDPPLPPPPPPPVWANLMYRACIHALKYHYIYLYTLAPVQGSNNFTSIISAKKLIIAHLTVQ